MRTHPLTGRDALFLGRRRNAWVVGKSVAESEALLDRLWAHAGASAHTWHHRWAVGDLLVWDNRCVLHRRDAFDPASRRLMYRTQVAGDRPFLCDRDPGQSAGAPAVHALAQRAEGHPSNGRSEGGWPGDDLALDQEPAAGDSRRHSR